MKLLLENWRQYLKEEIYYHGGGKDFLPTRIGTFYSKDKTYAEKYAAQHRDGQVSEVEIDLSQANVYPKVFWWQEFQETMKIAPESKVFIERPWGFSWVSSSFGGSDHLAPWG